MTPIDWHDVARRSDEGNGRPVDELWAWVKVYGPGDEGLAALVIPGAEPLPGVFARRDMADRVAPMMLAAQRQQGIPHRLVRYVRTDDAPS